MTQHPIVVKRNGERQTEPYDREKLFASVQSACLSVRSHEGEAELTTNKVCDAVDIWLAKHPEVTSGDLRRIAGNMLQQFHPEAAYFYSRHKHIL